MNYRRFSYNSLCLLVDTDVLDLGPHQEVSHYEVAAGTNRQYPRTRSDIHPFVNVGQNKSWTFDHLKLIPRAAYYFVTVKAYSVSDTMAEVSSNGIQVGYGGHIIALGNIYLNR